MNFIDEGRYLRRNGAHVVPRKQGKLVSREIIPPLPAKPKTKLISLRVEEKLLVEIDAVAKHSRRTRTAVINLGLEWTVKEYWEQKGLKR